MIKRSLVFGTLALLMLALLVFVGCSNPSSGEGTSAPQATSGGDYPAGTVFTDDFDQLEGLLGNASTVETNDVTHIAFEAKGALSRSLTIPTGKIVYLYSTANSGYTLTLASDNNIIVESGGELVVRPGITLKTASDGKLLVKGKVEVFGGLQVDGGAGTNPAMQVADYFDDGATKTARDTVIGTARVLVGPGGWLVLTADDIANQATPNRFTPPQAWAAAGQGSLGISDTLGSAYTVKYLLEGIALPAGGRRYLINDTQGGGVLPSVIPAGAYISVSGVIEDAENHTLTVNGGLTATNAASTFKGIEALTVNGSLVANEATFESVKTLKVSSLDNDELPSRAATLPSSVVGGSLEADRATLEKAESIIIGDYGTFTSASTLIDLPEGAKISLGRSAAFNASGAVNNSFDNLASLFIGPASEVGIDSSAVTFKSLKTLTLQDGAVLSVNPTGDSVTYLIEATPSTPPKKTEITWGLNTRYVVGVASSAKVDVAITNDASLISGSTVTVNAGSTFAVADGKTLTVPAGAAVDLSGLITSTTTAPTNTADAPVQIRGTIELTGSGALTGPDPAVLSNALDVYKFVGFGDNGKILLNWGTAYTMGASKIVGVDGAGAAYEWVGSTSDGAQIVIDGAGLTIRDRNGGGAGVTIGTGSAFVLKEQTLTLETGVTLTIDTVDTGLWLAGDAGTNGGALLKGPGSIVVLDGSDEIARITGGSSGWRVHGSDTIGIGRTSAGGFTTIRNSATGQTSLRALGPGADITVAAGKTLRIDTNTVVELGGSATSAWGSITLMAATSGNSGGVLSLVATTSKLLLGAGTGGTPATNITTITIGGKAVTNAGLASGDLSIIGTNDTTANTSKGVLVQIGGTTAGTLTASGTTTSSSNADVRIASNAAFSGS